MHRDVLSVCVCLFCVCVPLPHSAQCTTVTLNRTMTIKCFKTTQPQTKPNSYPDTLYLLHLKHTHTQKPHHFSAVFVLGVVIVSNCGLIGVVSEKNKWLATAGPSLHYSDWPAGRHCRVISCQKSHTGFHKLINTNTHVLCMCVFTCVV